MNQDQHPRHSQLFTVRVWLERLGEGRTEWRGEIQHVASGETHYFRNWPAVIQFILAALPGAERDVDLSEEGRREKKAY